jgi:hypothetical protein
LTALPQGTGSHQYRIILIGFGSEKSTATNQNVAALKLAVNWTNNIAVYLHLGLVAIAALHCIKRQLCKS